MDENNQKTGTYINLNGCRLCKKSWDLVTDCLDALRPIARRFLASGIIARVVIKVEL